MQEHGAWCEVEVLLLLLLAPCWHVLHRREHHDRSAAHAVAPSPSAPPAGTCISCATRASLGDGQSGPQQAPSAHSPTHCSRRSCASENSSAAFLSAPAWRVRARCRHARSPWSCPYAPIQEAQYPLARDFCQNHWWCDLKIAPGLHSWEKPSSKLYDKQEVLADLAVAPSLAPRRCLLCRQALHMSAAVQLYL